MYIEHTASGYGRNGQQVARRARFLILIQDASLPIGPENMRAVVRKVALRQLGHWMMGRTRIGRNWYTVSGSYGHDGLPLTVDSDAYSRGIPVPAELHEAWNNGGGWNSCGSEAGAMREWARKTFKD